MKGSGKRPACAKPPTDGSIRDNKIPSLKALMDNPTNTSAEKAVIRRSGGAPGANFRKQ
jgi:hypothetical protein